MLYITTHNNNIWLEWTKIVAEYRSRTRDTKSACLKTSSMFSHCKAQLVFSCIRRQFWEIVLCCQTGSSWHPLGKTWKKTFWKQSMRRWKKIWTPQIHLHFHVKPPLHRLHIQYIIHHPEKKNKRLWVSSEEKKKNLKQMSSWVFTHSQNPYWEMLIFLWIFDRSISIFWKRACRKSEAVA